MAPSDDDEDDYMNMIVQDTAPKYETDLQRAARRRKEGEAKSRQKTKAEREADAEAAREAALATALPVTSKGFKMMAKFGFKQGDALGKSDDARKEPIQVTIKHGRSGIGLESEKKRKCREQFEQAERLVKREKEDEGDYLEARRQQQKAKMAEKDLYNAQSAAERLHERDAHASSPSGCVELPLRDINVLWRIRARQRLEAKHDMRQRRELENSLASRLPTLAAEAEDDDCKIAQGEDVKPFYTTLEQDLEDGDAELAAFEALEVVERLQKLLAFLRDEHHYCLYCGFEYPDEIMEDCPGITREDHD